MTRIMFLPDNQEAVWLDDPRPVEELLASVKRGEWRPPEPYRNQARGIVFRGVQFQGWVIIAPETTGETTQANGLPVELSERQKDVLQGLADGLGDKEIAARIHISRSMIARHVAHMNRRLGTRTRSQLVSRAVALGLVKMKRREKK